MIEINRILCPIDFSPFSERALQHAMTLAVWYGAKLQVLHVMPHLPPSSLSDLATQDRRRSARELRAAIERCRIPGADVAAELVESAEPAPRILESADRFDADLIVTGSHGRSGVQRALLGSVAEALLHRCARPIMTIPSHVAESTERPFSRILCAVDFSDASLAAMEYALSMAEEADGQLSLLHVIEMPPELSHAPQPPDFDIAPIRAAAEAECQTRLEALVPAQARDYCRVETAVLEGGAARQILRSADAQQANLIVLGVHGRNVFDLAFFGSNSKEIIRKAHCPVLIVPTSRRLAATKAAS